MTIEFVGVPGAGKSSLYTYLGTRLAADGVSTSSFVPAADEQARQAVQLRKLRDVGLFGGRHPATVRDVAGVIRRSRQQQRRDATTKTVNLLAEMQRARSGTAARLTEQGVLQAIWSAALRARSPVTQDLLQRCRLWLPHTAVLVTVDRGEVLRRLQLRESGRSRLDQADPERVTSDLARGDRLMSELLRLWEGLDADHRVIEVQNVRDAAPSAVLDPHFQFISQRMQCKEK